MTGAGGTVFDQSRWTIIVRDMSNSCNCLNVACLEGVQYCQWETFNASCTSQTDHVILMTSARYGRMRFGRCMREDHGSVGCSADVLAHLDRRCSGRRTCQLSIPDATLHANHPCPKELMPYLEASYSCVRRKLHRRRTRFRPLWTANAAQNRYDPFPISCLETHKSLVNQRVQC